jgi:hypothetical protein
MTPRALRCLLLAALALGLAGQVRADGAVPPAAPQPMAEPEPATPTASTLSPAADLSAFAVGVGYPDVRLRFGLGQDWSLEAKGAFAQGLQIYSGRVSWDFAALGPLRAMAGAEGGWAKFDGLDSISGDGAYAGGFLGLEYPLARRLRVTVDIGPAWLQASSQNHSLSAVDVIYNTALYFYLF